MPQTKVNPSPGRFILATTKSKNKDAERSLYLRYTLGKEQAVASTGVKVKAKDWNSTKQLVKNSNPDAIILNRVLSAKKDKVDKQIAEYEAEFTIQILREMVQGTFEKHKEESRDFVSLCIEALQTEYKLDKLRYATYYNGIRYMEVFKHFLKIQYGKEFISTDKMNGEVIDQYILWRKEERNNGNHSINKTVTPLIKGIRLGVTKGVMSHSVLVDAQNKYLSDSRYKEDEIERNDKSVQYLTLPQLQQFVELYYTVKYDRTRDYMDLFLFSFYACGLRFSDLLTLRWCNIDMDTWTLKKVMYKGHRKQYCFTLLPEAREILLRWHKRTAKKEFVFGLLPKKFDLTNDEEINKARQNKARSVRTSLNEIGRKMNLPFNLGIHVARHTFAVHALERIKDVYKVSTMLMHSSIDVTQKVYAKYLPETIEEDMIKLSFGILPSK